MADRNFNEAGDSRRNWTHFIQRGGRMYHVGSALLFHDAHDTHWKRFLFRRRGAVQTRYDFLCHFSIGRFWSIGWSLCTMTSSRCVRLGQDMACRWRSAVSPQSMKSEDWVTFSKERYGREKSSCAYRTGLANVFLLMASGSVGYHASPRAT